MVKYKIRVGLLVLCIIQSVFLAPMFAQPLFRDALNGGITASISMPTIPAAPALNFQKRPVFDEGINAFIVCAHLHSLSVVAALALLPFFISGLLRLPDQAHNLSLLVVSRK